MTPPTTVAELLKRAIEDLSPAERRIARALLADYPVAGLEPVHRLAERANVSAPTVLRLLQKLEIGAYPTMQRMLRDEISARSTSPLLLYKERAESGAAYDEDSLLAEHRQELIRSLELTFDALLRSEFQRVVEVLSNPRLQIWTVGGRFSDLIAQYLQLHLQLLRKGARHVGPSEHDRPLALMDFGPKDVLVAFDYRRYQESTVDFLRQAKERKSTTVLFTDPWMSPAARYADHVLSSPVASTSPFDSLTPSFALVETVIAGIVEHLDDAPRARIAAFDELQAPMLYSGEGPADVTQDSPETQERS